MENHVQSAPTFTKWTDVVIINNICYLLNAYFVPEIFHVIYIIYIITLHVNIIFYLLHKTEV